VQQNPYRIEENLKMSKRSKIWAFAAALLGSSLMQFGCGGGSGLWSWTTILAILQEDLFG
jgi:hypothetical protein